MVSRNGHINDEIEIRVPCKAEYVRTIRRTIADFALSADLSRSAVEEVEIAASEAASNIIRHAYTGFEDMPALKVKCSRGRNGLMVEIADKGRGFELPPEGAIPEVDINREGGMGIILIRCLMDRVVYTSKPDKGTRIRMTKRNDTVRLDTDHPVKLLNYR